MTTHSFETLLPDHPQDLPILVHFNASKGYTGGRILEIVGVYKRSNPVNLSASILLTHEQEAQLLDEAKDFLMEYSK